MFFKRNAMDYLYLYNKYLNYFTIISKKKISLKINYTALVNQLIRYLSKIENEKLNELKNYIYFYTFDILYNC